MFGDAYRYRETRACFFLRGLVPKVLTHRPPVDDYHIEDVPESEWVMYDPTQPVFLDGTGGPHSQDFRIRVCGWAWI